MGGDECTPAGNDGWIGRRWTDRRIDRWMDRYTERPIDRYVLKDWYMAGRTDGQMDGKQIDR